MCLLVFYVRSHGITTEENFGVQQDCQQHGALAHFTILLKKIIVLDLKLKSLFFERVELFYSHIGGPSKGDKVSSNLP